MGSQDISESKYLPQDGYRIPVIWVRIWGFCIASMGKAQPFIVDRAHCEFGFTSEMLPRRPKSLRKVDGGIRNSLAVDDSIDIICTAT